MEVTEIELCNMLASSNAGSVRISNETTDDDAAMSRQQGASWSNLWE